LKRIRACGSIAENMGRARSRLASTKSSFVVLRCEPTGPARRGALDDKLRESRRRRTASKSAVADLDTNIFRNRQSRFRLAPRPHPSRAALRAPQHDGTQS
jgi:hypothetical protein